MTEEVQEIVIRIELEDPVPKWQVQEMKEKVFKFLQEQYPSMDWEEW